MSSRPKAIVIRSAGINCDEEMVRGFELAGAEVDLVHLDTLAAEPERLGGYAIIGFPGGFSYGDDIASGRVYAVKTRERLYPALRRAAERGAYMLGICNGFQVMVQAGLLPGPVDGVWPELPPRQTLSLTDNQSARFIDDWEAMIPDTASPCVWTRGLEEDPQAILPIAHGEGRFVCPDALLEELTARGQIALRYGTNLNGSDGAVAGVCDVSGRLFGLMPHPDRFLDWNRHPSWTRFADRSGDPLGLRIFRNAVEAATPAAASTA